MLRVGLLMDSPSPHMVDLLNALAKRRDCAVQVIYFDRTAPGRNWGAPPGKLPYVFAGAENGAGPLGKVARIGRLVSEAVVDAWIVNSCYTAPETWLAVRQLNAAALPWVYMNEPIRPRGMANGVKTAVVRTLLRNAAGVVGMGREARLRYLELLRGAVPSTSTPYYIDLEPFLRLPLPTAPSGSEPVRFLAVGQMIHRKAFDVLLAACALLPAAGWTLTIAGKGPLQEKFENEFRTRWSTEQVIFLGEVGFAERASVFSNKHVFVFPSRWDGWGMAPIEAMAAGLPVISSDQVMSMREFVNDGVNGYLIQSENSIVLSKRMRTFIDAPQKIPAMGLAARSALRDYRAEVGAARLVEFMNEIMEQSRLRKLSNNAAPSEGCDWVPTWKELTTPPSRRERLSKKTRVLAKRIVIGTSLRLPGRTSAPGGHRILVYHLVLPEDRERFSTHLKYLKDHFRVVTASQLVRDRECSATEPIAAITFDDGFKVLMKDALELLDKFDVKASFYVPTKFIESAVNRETAAMFSMGAHFYQKPLDPMDIDDLRLLQRMGHEIGSHGVSHVGLHEVSQELAAFELESSRKRLGEWLEKEPTGYAYPYGKTESSLGDPANWVAAAGYEYAVTLRRGPVEAGANKMLLPREHIEGNWRVRDLEYFLSRPVRQSE